MNTMKLPKKNVRDTESYFPRGINQHLCALERPRKAQSTEKLADKLISKLELDNVTLQPKIRIRIRAFGALNGV